VISGAEATHSNGEVPDLARHLLVLVLVLVLLLLVLVLVLLLVLLLLLLLALLLSCCCSSSCYSSCCSWQAVISGAEAADSNGEVPISV